MSTKISALDERTQSDIIGDEFFPIIDGGDGSTTATTGYQTFKIKLDTLFQSGQGFEKLTDVSVVQGATFDDDATIDFDGTPTALDGNKFFTLQYTDEAGDVTKLKIQKYVIENGDVKFEHIDTTDFVTSTQRISANANSVANDKLVTAAAVDEHILHIEDLLFDNSDSKIKEYFGDSTTDRISGTHILKEFRLNSEVAQDFIDLQNGATTLTTFKAIEDKFDIVGVDLELKIATSQVNLNHFRIDSTQPNLNNRLNIRDLGIKRELIADNAINSQKISNRGILNANISNEAITARTILNSNVTTEKIRFGAITPDKISANGPSWDANNVNIPNGLNVADDVIVNSNISQKGTTFSIFNSSRSSTPHSGRALVHTAGNKLTVNELNDFDGGVIIRGVVTVPSMDLSNIFNGGARSVVTKEYVDRADILLNPIGEDKIQDNAIEIRHMTDNSVDTPEIVDEAITSPKIETVGPHWDGTGKVQVSGDLDVAGTTATIGTSGSNSNLILHTGARGDRTGFAQITRSNGSSGDLLIKNLRGNIKFGTTGGNTDLTISGTRATFAKGLTINGDGTTTIAGTNFNNPALLIGSSVTGMAIDNNEIIQKGRHLILGVVDGASQDIQFKQGGFELATIRGNTGNFSTLGDIISETGVFKRNDDTGNLTLRGGTTDANGATIKLFGTDNALNKNQVIHNADKHVFSNKVGNSTILEIDSLSKKVTLSVQGTQANHLINKQYVDTKKIAPSDLTAGGPQWNSTTVTIPDNLAVTDIASVGDNLNVGGQITQNGADFKIFNPTRAGTGNIHAGRALVHGTGDKLTINHAGDYTAGVEVRGKVIASDQTKTIISANSRALTTREYVAAEIAKVHPDDYYVSVGGDNMTGNLTWNTQSGNGLAWSNNSDIASIKFYNTRDGDPDCRLEFEIGDNNNEFFRFVMSPFGREKVELLKISNTEFSYKGNTIYHAGNDGSGSGLDADKLDGNHGSYYLNAQNLTGDISDARLPDFITPIDGVQTKEIRTSTKQELILNAGESSGKISGQTNEYVYVNAEQGLSVNTPTFANRNWVGGVEIDTTVIKGDSISVGGVGNTVWHAGNDGSGSGLDADKLDGLDASSFARPNTNISVSTPTSDSHAATKKYVDDKDNFKIIRTKDDITTRTESGFYESNTGTKAEGWPEDSASWQHLITSTHSNTNNYYALQIASNFFNQEFYFRNTHNNGKKEWSKVWHSNNVGSGSGLDADKLDGKEGSYYLNITNSTGTISDDRLPNVITPLTSVTTREIKTSRSQELILNAGESSGKVPNQVNEYVYINAEGGLSVNTPKVTNWQGGAAGGFNETIITGKNISIGGNTVFTTANDGSGSGLDADKLDGLHASSFARPNTNIAVSAPTSDSHAATKKYVDDTCNINQLNILKKVYPIGVLYTSLSGTNPNSLFGFGTWVEYGKGRMPIGVNTSDNDFKTPGKTGGAKTVTLTTAQMPSHSHTLRGNNRGYSSRQLDAPGLYRDDAEGYSTDPNTIQPTGGGQPHNNMPPYVTIYMWRRTA